MGVEIVEGVAAARMYGTDDIARSLLLAASEMDRQAITTLAAWKNIVSILNRRNALRAFTKGISATCREMVSFAV